METYPDSKRGTIHDNVEDITYNTHKQCPIVELKSQHGDENHDYKKNSFTPKDKEDSILKMDIYVKKYTYKFMYIMLVSL